VWRYNSFNKIEETGGHEVAEPFYYIRHCHPEREVNTIPKPERVEK
jgi:hypothetical protein